MLNVEYISEFGISSTIISIQSLSINFIHNIQVAGTRLTYLLVLAEVARNRILIQQLLHILCMHFH